jgi:hypothetical protein
MSRQWDGFDKLDPMSSARQVALFRIGAEIPSRSAVGLRDAVQLGNFSEAHLQHGTVADAVSVETSVGGVRPGWAHPKRGGARRAGPGGTGVSAW